MRDILGEECWIWSCQNNPLKVIMSPRNNENYKLPFLRGPIGHSIVLVGKPTGGNDSEWAIDLVSWDKKNIQFHFNPRMGSAIIRNTFQYGVGWGSEERTLDFPFPFIKDVPFTVKIKIESEKFNVDINGMHAFNYQKRMDMCGISSIQLRTAVKAEKLEFY